MRVASRTGVLACPFSIYMHNRQAGTLSYLGPAVFWFRLRIPGQGERDSGVNVKSVPGRR